MKGFLTLILLLSPSLLFSQKTVPVIDKADLLFLEGMTKAVLDSSRLAPGQALPEPFGNNNTGGELIRPGGRSTYPAFWIRDYTMSLEAGFITKAEQRHMLLLTASSQCDQAWITQGGSMVPFGAIPDHIRVDNSLPIYFPGTYDYEEQGIKEFGMLPPYDDQFYFIHMAYYYVKNTGDAQLLFSKVHDIRIIDRLEIAFNMPPSRQDNGIVYTNESFRGVDFGFRDAEVITGDLCFPSMLKYRAANELAELFVLLNKEDKAKVCRKIAASIKAAIPGIFTGKKGMLLASTGIGSQPDVWATAFAVYLHVLSGDNLLRACSCLSEAYQKGTLSFEGNIRHILVGDDYNDNTAWQRSIVPKNQYQNGAYWGTPVGWVAYAIARVNPEGARQLTKEYINELRQHDFRKGADFGAPFECFYPPNYTRGPVYLTSVSCPYIIFRLLSGK